MAELVTGNITTGKLTITTTDVEGQAPDGPTIGEGVIRQGATSTIIQASVIGVYEKVFVMPRTLFEHSLAITYL